MPVSRQKSAIKMLHPPFHSLFMVVIVDALPFGAVVWKPTPLTTAGQKIKDGLEHRL